MSAANCGPTFHIANQRGMPVDVSKEIFDVFNYQLGLCKREAGENVNKEAIRQSYIVGLRDGVSGVFTDKDEGRIQQQVERLYCETITLDKSPVERDYIVIEINKKTEGDIGKYLQKMVGLWIKKGFVPSGGAFTTDNMVFQPMIKKST